MMWACVEGPNLRPRLGSVETELEMLCDGVGKVTTGIGGVTAALTTYLVFGFHETALYPGALLLVVADAFCVHEFGEGSDDLLVDHGELVGFFRVHVVDAITRGCASPGADGDGVTGCRERCRALWRRRRR
jgi:hypothetical protein